jgi:DNA polymerase-1
MPNTKETVVLIDGDQIAYKAAFACEQEIKWNEDIWSLVSSESDVRSVIDAQIKQGKKETGASSVIVAVSGSDNFRKDICSSYKANRTARKPLGLKAALEYLKNEYEALCADRLEADDVIGIEAASNSNYIIWATDKDYFTVPCKLHQGGKLYKISQKQADHNLRVQTITGDTVDNYKGVKGYGIKRAKAWLEKHHDTWQSVYDLFIKNGQTEHDFLTNAKLARIFRSSEDYTWKPTYDITKTTTS